MNKSNTKYNQYGATIVEFALILPLLILLIFGVIEFSLAMYNQTMVTNAARQGARYGVVWGPTYNETSYRIEKNDIEAFTASWLGNNLVSFGNSTANIIVTADDPLDQCDGEETDQILKVRVTYDYDFLILPVGPITLRSEANMKCESASPPPSQP